MARVYFNQPQDLDNDKVFRKYFSELTFYTHSHLDENIELTSRTLLANVYRKIILIREDNPMLHQFLHDKECYISSRAYEHNLEGLDKYSLNYSEKENRYVGDN